MFKSKGKAVAIGMLAGIVISACHNGVTALSAPQRSDRAVQTPQSTATDWGPSWNTSPDISRKAKAQLIPTVSFADDGFRGSPIFESQDQRASNAEARDAFAQSFPNIPECSGITLVLKNSQATDFVLQIFKGINGRTRRLQWVLYRTDILGESAHGEGAGADSQMGQDAIVSSVCSSIRNAVIPESGKVREFQPSTVTIQPLIDAWENSAKSIEDSYSHFLYNFPSGFVALSEDIRTAENRKRYETQLADALRKEGPNRETRKSVDGKEVTETHKIEVFPPYVLLVVARTAPSTSETNQLPRLRIAVHKRIAMLMEAGDPARMVTYVPQVRVLRGPEDITLSGQKFVRADFQFHSGDYLSKFSTVVGDYLLEFDFRADNEKDLTDMVTSMQSLVFRP